MIGEQYSPIVFTDNFYGVNTKDTYDNMLDGEWDEESKNIFSDPLGSLGSRPGFSALTTASIGTATAWNGFYQYDIHSGGSTTNNYIGAGSDGKLYKFASNTYTEIASGLATGFNALWSFLTLNNKCLAVSAGSTPLIYTGTGSAATFATSVTADFCLEWQRYAWCHSTADPRLMYYSPLGEPDGAYTTFLNFDMDNDAVTGSVKQGDDMIVGKPNRLYRVQYRGTTPLFKIYNIPAKIGPVNFWSMKELPDGKNVFLAPDCNFYMLFGDTLVPVGDNIKNYVKDGVRSRLQYAVSGLLYARNQYWCSFTYSSGATSHDRTLVMDYSRPYQDKWGRTQYPWFIYTIGANCFAEVTISGQQFLYHGGYIGKMYKDDTGTNDDGSAFVASYVSKRITNGDATLEKKYAKFNISYADSGDWDLDISFEVDANASTQKVITQNMQGGIGSSANWGSVNWDSFNWPGESNADVSRDIDRQGKLIKITMSTDGLNESWLVYSFSIISKAVRRAVRNRE